MFYYLSLVKKNRNILEYLTPILLVLQKKKFIEIVVHFSTTVFSFFLKLYKVEKRFSGRYITISHKKKYTHNITGCIL